MLLCSNPGNPTGAVYGADQLRRVAKWAKRNGIWLVADEVYRAIWFSLAIVARVMSRAGFHETVAPLLDRPLGEDHLVEGGQRRDVGVDQPTRLCECEGDHVGWGPA